MTWPEMLLLLCVCKLQFFALHYCLGLTGTFCRLVRLTALVPAFNCVLNTVLAGDPHVASNDVWQGTCRHLPKVRRC